MLELKPVDSHKSFYGKAIVKDFKGATLLQSYNTDVCMVKDSRFVRLWGGYSATTMRHVNAFLAFCGLAGGGKAWWDAQPVQSR